MISTRKTMIAALAISLGGAVWAYWPGEHDYSTLPPAFDLVSSKLGTSVTNLKQAIEIAEKATGGLAASATMNLDETPATISVVVYNGAEAWSVTVDATDGQIKEKSQNSRFPGDPISGEMTTTDSGLMYYEIRVGDGPQPTGPTSSVTVHYTGWTTDGSKFDSSVDRGQPATFPLNRVIGGWTEGVGSMRVGGKRKLLIPFDLAYGAAGRAPTIPPKAMLIFDVELISIAAE